GEQAFAVEDLFQLGSGLGDRLRVGVDQVGRHSVVVVELHAVEAELLVLAELAGEGQLLANRRPERVGAGADVPGTEGESIAARSRCRGHVSNPTNGKKKVIAVAEIVSVRKTLNHETHEKRDLGRLFRVFRVFRG